MLSWLTVAVAQSFSGGFVIRYVFPSVVYYVILHIIVRSRKFKCSLDHVKKSHYRSANAIFGKIGRYASEDVTFKLINVKCVHILMYGLEACPLVKSDLSSLDFAINRFFMKLFRTNNIDVVKCCQYYFVFDVKVLTFQRKISKFLFRNGISKLISNVKGALDARSKNLPKFVLGYLLLSHDFSKIDIIVYVILF